MERNEVKKREKKPVSISIRTTKAKAKFMGDNDLSPNAIFDKALDELMKKK